MSQIKPTVPIALNDAKPKPIRRQEHKLDAFEREKLKLRKATQEFESFFTASMLKSMRQTVPKNEQEGAVGGTGLGKDIFQSMFDEELSKKMATGSHGGLGDILYQNLVKRIEAKYATEADTTEAQDTAADEATRRFGLKEVTQSPKQE